MRTSLTVPEELLDEFDETWQSEGLDSRSRAIRQAMSEYVERHRTLEDAEGEVTGAIVTDYEHHTAVEQLYDIQHEYDDAIISTAHAHRGDWCLETMFVHGEAARIRELAYRLKNFDGVRRVRTMTL